MKLVRVTMLESFRRFRDEVTENFDTEEKLIETISGKFAGNEKTTIGSAFHSIIETGKNKDNRVVFSENQINLALLHKQNLGVFIPEIRSQKQYGNLIVSGAIDILQGNVIRDTKTKFRNASVIDYLDSCQWRFYLDIFGLESFIYDIFEFKGYDEKLGLDVSGCELVQHDPFGCHNYANLQNDLHQLIYDFGRWVDFRELWHLLPNV